MDIKRMALCEGRHEISEAVDGSIYSNTVNPLDFQGMQERVSSKLAGVNKLHLYVTGLTVALIEVINFCHSHNVELTLWHYDRESGKYYPQSVI